MDRSTRLREEPVISGDEPEYVVIGTKDGSGFFGEKCRKQPPGVDGSCIFLLDAQMILQIAPDTRTWFDLAVNGPSRNCAVSPAVEYALIGDVRHILKCTPQAAEAWKKAPWPTGGIVTPHQADKKLVSLNG
jgi:hypothetical protein